MCVLISEEGRKKTKKKVIKTYISERNYQNKRLIPVPKLVLHRGFVLKEVS